MFKKVLVANRGEIALRVLRTCKEMGINTVAIYSEADRDSLHLRHADEAYLIGPAPARDSYLRIDKVIEVAKKCGAEAIHPGYGFLAENAEFARACTDAEIVFIGPTAANLEAMGDKVKARQMAIRAGIPVVPGTQVKVGSLEEAAAAAEKLGYAVLVKAAAGGGGKGMRLVERPEELPGAIQEATREAGAAFGNGAVYLEKFLSETRHIEFQVLGDRYGNVIHLGERECSIQRRHQKLIEEAPSTVLDDKFREKMGQAALALAKAARYESAGSVEFLLDRQGNFYFMEMNTRIQVEHVVTELVTGVDLVEEQVRIAAGEKLRYKQRDIRINGWAIECRIAAEDPYDNFMPSPGRVSVLYEPSGPGIRVDSEVFAGLEVSLYYDPLISKLAVWGKNREQAIARMRRALVEYKMLGVKNNVPFHLQMMNNPDFVAGRFDTTFLDKHFVMPGDATKKHAQIAAMVAVALAQQKKSPRFVAQKDGKSPAISPWRMAARREAQRKW